ncbi:hypothetical protein [Vibrio chagasii]|uniref:hypothetical protein n=1 Tax=Vibrio chagasii TaxID=170679 RepID=UPI002283C442|nr:hypothetical protein [Vibrio chagasii]MCY9826402.1 hypothetical protein [Vibrio chagasii]
MIIGNGLLASKFREYKNSNVIIFASGVSNSLETRDSEFEREKILLLETLNKNSGDIVYFGSCSQYDPSLESSAYVKHKIEMESLIKNKRDNYYILRLAQVVGKANNQTFINYLYTEIINNRKINVWKNASRNLISTNLILDIASYIISNEMYGDYNIAYFDNENVLEIVNYLGEVLDKNVQINLLEKGEEYDIPLGKVEDILEIVGVTRDKKKYYIELLKDFVEN